MIVNFPAPAPQPQLLLGFTCHYLCSLPPLLATSSTPRPLPLPLLATSSSPHPLCLPLLTTSALTIICHRLCSPLPSLAVNCDCLCSPLLRSLRSLKPLPTLTLACHCLPFSSGPLLLKSHSLASYSLLLQPSILNEFYSFLV